MMMMSLPNLEEFMEKSESLLQENIICSTSNDVSIFKELVDEQPVENQNSLIFGLDVLSDLSTTPSPLEPILPSCDQDDQCLYTNNQIQNSSGSYTTIQPIYQQEMETLESVLNNYYLFDSPNPLLPLNTDDLQAVDVRPNELESEILVPTIKPKQTECRRVREICASKTFGSCTTITSNEQIGNLFGNCEPENFKSEIYDLNLTTNEKLVMNQTPLLSPSSFRDIIDSFSDGSIISFIDQGYSKKANNGMEADLIVDSLTSSVLSNTPMPQKQPKKRGRPSKGQPSHDVQALDLLKADYGMEAEPNVVPSTSSDLPTRTMPQKQPKKRGRPSKVQPNQDVQAVVSLQNSCASPKGSYKKNPQRKTQRLHVRKPDLEEEEDLSSEEEEEDHSFPPQKRNSNFLSPQDQEKRIKNNLSSKRSREKSKIKIKKDEEQREILEKQNQSLKHTLEKLEQKIKTALEALCVLGSGKYQQEGTRPRN